MGVPTGVLRRFASLALALLLMALPSPALNASEDACPSIVAGADRLMLAVAGTMSSVSGRATLFERHEAGWRATSDPFPIVFGRKGIGWSFDQSDLAASSGGPSTPTKAEGDGRTPAGVFQAGRPFGFGKLRLDSYIEIIPETVCVDDLDSGLYNQVINLQQVPDGLRHEKMSKVPQYRRGLIINNQTSRQAQGGSCIFLHVWRGPGQGTAGCVAAAQPDVEKTQALFSGQPSAIAILPRVALDVLAGCGLPAGFDAASRAP
jgi:D-alanyl-D-alanine dipeptidase